MRLDSLSSDQIVRLIGAGAGLRLDASRRSVADLVAIAVAAGAGGSGHGIAFHSCRDLTLDDRIRVAEAAPGRVFFDD